MMQQLTVEFYPHPVGHRLDTPRPYLLVQFGIKAHIVGSHCLLGKVDDRFDGPGSPLLERTTVDALVEMDGVLPRHDILQSGALSSL